MDFEKLFRKTPLGWKVNLMNILTVSLMCLADSIDKDLRKIKDEEGNTLYFNHDKKKLYSRFCSNLSDGANLFQEKFRDAEKWFDKLDIDGQVWKALDKDVRMYDNFTADAKELLQAMMLYFDRARTDKGYYQILRFMRNLPSSNVFPEEEIDKFTYKRPIVLQKGIDVKTAYGEGTLDMRTNGDNWIINMKDGTQKVLTEKQFSILY